MSSPTRTIGIPWSAPVFERLNAQHPLPSSLITDTHPEFTFRRDLAPITAETQALVQQAVAEFCATLPPKAAAIDRQELIEFISSRDLDSQYMMSGPVDLNFIHTAPATLGQRPWAMHVESTLPVFVPYFGPFKSWDVDLDATPGWHFIRHLIAMPACRAIFTHLRRTQAELPKLLRAPHLASKIHYAPLGIEMPAAYRRPAEEAIARKNAKGADDELVFLFTNSWHQLPGSFLIRGGLEVLFSFLLLLKSRPNCRLIIRSALPQGVHEQLPEDIRRSSNIEWIDRSIADTELYDLYSKADFFLLPSRNLHTISMLRAMQMGAVLITSDVPGVEEFVRHEENGLIMPGWQGVSYREDEEQGLLRERAFEDVPTVNSVLVANLSVTMNRLVEERDFRNRLRMNAVRHVATDHPIGPWREGFYAMLRSCFAPQLV